MVELPSGIATAIPKDARPAVERWWASLAEAERHEAAALWDERREVCFFAPQSNEAGRADDWDQVPAVVGGRFVPHDDAVRMAEWQEDWQEYVSGHEEVVLLPRVAVVFRTFHICQAEPEARAVAVSALLPAAFQCPVGSGDCPMRRVQVAAPNQALHLAAAAAGGWWVVAPWSGRGR
jgi:hypothetical protein